MPNKILLILILTLSCGSLNASAQEQTASKTISGGVINGKADSLPKPEYSAAARAVKASGAVNVQVTIDENGDIISAAAVSGHPLLRQAAEQAARQAKFKPTLLAGQPVKVTGVLVYNFVPASTSKIFMTNWLQTGMSLATLDKSPTLRYFQPEAVAQMMPPDWTAERQQIQRLDELKKTELETASGDAPKERVIDERVIENQKDSMSVNSTTTVVTASPDKRISSEITALGQSLIASIQGRLAAEPLNLWYFDLGLNINRALDKADSRSKNERFDSVLPFREFIKTASPEIPKEILDELQKMVLMMEKGIFTDEDKIILTQSLMKLNTFPGN